MTPNPHDATTSGKSMTADEHQAEAERLLAEADRMAQPGAVKATVDLLIVRAQIHSGLALTSYARELRDQARRT